MMERPLENQFPRLEVEQGLLLTSVRPFSLAIPATLFLDTTAPVSADWMQEGVLGH